MKINEIFYSLSGEGLSQGLPTIFIRTAGCNFQEHPCKYCDTKYSLKKSSGKEIEIDKILQFMEQWNCKRIIITGGEPLFQPDIDNLIKQLGKYIVEIETNGSLSIVPFNNLNLIWSLDIKCPYSGNHNYNVEGNLLFTRPRDQIKFVVSNYSDFLFAIHILDKYKPLGNIIFSSVWGMCNLQELAEWIKNEYPAGRLGIQLHKIIWGDKKGV